MATRPLTLAAPAGARRGPGLGAGLLLLAALGLLGLCLALARGSVSAEAPGTPWPWLLGTLALLLLGAAGLRGTAQGEGRLARTLPAAGARLESGSVPGGGFRLRLVVP